MKKQMFRSFFAIALIFSVSFLFSGCIRKQPPVKPKPQAQQQQGDQRLERSGEKQGAQQTQGAQGQSAGSIDVSSDQKAEAALNDLENLPDTENGEDFDNSDIESF